MDRNIFNLKKTNMIILIVSLAILVSFIMFTRVVLAKETYKIIELQKEIDNIKKEREVLNETISEFSSPIRIREIAIEKLKMIPVLTPDDIVNQTSP